MQVKSPIAITKMGSWYMRSLLHRWISAEPEKFTKDHFLSALDAVSAGNDDGSESISAQIQHSLPGSWKNMTGSDHPRYFFYHDITKIRWNGHENDISEGDMDRWWEGRTLVLAFLYQGIITCPLTTFPAGRPRGSRWSGIVVFSAGRI